MELFSSPKGPYKGGEFGIFPNPRNYIKTVLGIFSSPKAHIKNSEFFRVPETIIMKVVLRIFLSPKTHIHMMNAKSNISTYSLISFTYSFIFSTYSYIFSMYSFIYLTYFSNNRNFSKSQSPGGFSKS